MTTVVILGTGNVARHLFDAFQQAEGVSVLQVAGRNKESLLYFKNVETVADYAQIREADVFIIAVSDDGIESTAANLSHVKGLVAHTSGSTPLSALEGCKRPAVFYPLQTFSKDSQVDFSEIPFCLEAKDATDYQYLEALGGALSDRLFRINSKERLALHLAAVFVNNFSNHMYYLGQSICESHGLSFNLLQPLIRETAEKISRTTPYEAQTGPARRQDFNTMQLQMEELPSDQLVSIYKILSESIQNTYAGDL